MSVSNKFTPPKITKAWMHSFKNYVSKEHLLEKNKIPYKNQKAND